MKSNSMRKLETPTGTRTTPFDVSIRKLPVRGEMRRGRRTTWNVTFSPGANTTGENFVM